jgi:hypothetical protein
MKRPILLYATRADQLQVLEAVEAKHPLVYTESGMFEEPRIQTYYKASEIDNLGVSSKGNQIFEKTYMMHNPHDLIIIREVPQRKGGIRYAVDNRLNPRTVGLTPSGKFGSDAVISGQLGRGSDDPVSSELADLLKREFVKQFTRIKAYLVGPEAEALLDSGARLTIHSKASTEYDLKR